MQLYTILKLYARMCLHFFNFWPVGGSMVARQNGNFKANGSQIEKNKGFSLISKV